MKYNKKILANKIVYYNNRYAEVLVLDDKDYYNVHVLDDAHQDDEMNTLKLQEPKDCVALKK